MKCAICRQPSLSGCGRSAAATVTAARASFKQPSTSATSNATTQRGGSVRACSKDNDVIKRDGVIARGSSMPLGQGVAVVTDQNVPEGHKGLHNFLYGEKEDEVHGSGNQSSAAYRPVPGEDDASEIVPLQQYLNSRLSCKLAGVYGVYDDQEVLGYVGYARNIILSIKGHLAALGEQRCSAVRVQVVTDALLVSRAQLEGQREEWFGRYGTPAGNSSELHLWETSGRPQVQAMTAEELSEYEEKKLKMRKAMGENLHDDVEGEDVDARERRLRLLQAVEGDDWSSVIGTQTEATMGDSSKGTTYSAPAAAGNGSRSTSARTSRTTAGTGAGEAASQIISPFASGKSSGASGESSAALGSAPDLQLSVGTVDAVLEEVRPYLVADGGNVRVVGVEETTGRVSLELTGACGTCPSSTATMKMGIEKCLVDKFGSRVKEVVQVNPGAPITTLQSIDKHLDILRPAIQNFGGMVSVQSVDVAAGSCQVAYSGPAPVAMGIQAAIKDKFPDIREVTIVPFPGQ